MKKAALTALLALALTAAWGAAAAAQPTGPQHQLGFSFPTFGWVHLNEAGQVEYVNGFNFALGISHRTYPNGLAPGKFNFYWGWGTLVVIVPYFEGGVTYPISLGEAGEQLLNLDLGVLYIVPYLGISAMF